MMKYIKSDLCRYVGNENINIKNFIKKYIFNTGFKFSFWLRIAKYSKNPIIRLIARVQHGRFSQKYMLDIPFQTDIGYGLYLGHGKSIVINSSAKIGNNCNLSQFITIGSNHGQAAYIGNNVYIGPNVCIVEDVVIGDNSKIGAGAVVTKNIPANVTAAGVPAVVLKIDEAPNSYVNNRWPNLL